MLGPLSFLLKAAFQDVDSGAVRRAVAMKSKINSANEQTVTVSLAKTGDGEGDGGV